MKNEIPIDELSTLISEKEKELFELKRELRERQTAGLKAAMEARRDADRLVRDELKALGYSGRISSDFHPFFQHFN